MKKDFRLDKKLEKEVNAVAINPCQMKIEKMLGKGKEQIPLTNIDELSFKFVR